jgi:hypothetical protein
MLARASARNNRSAQDEPAAGARVDGRRPAPWIRPAAWRWSGRPPFPIGLVRAGTVLVLAGGLLAACAPSALSVPRPSDHLLPAPPPPVVEPSLLSLLVDLPVSRLLEAVDGALPREIARDGAWTDTARGAAGTGLQVQYRLWRDALWIEMVGDRLVTRLDLRYRLRARLAGAPVPLEGQCGFEGDAPRRLRIVASSTLAWTGSWGLSPTTTFAPPEFLDPCRALPGAADVTPLLQPLLGPGLQILARALDDRLAALTGFRERAGLAWERLGAPVAVAPGTWLALRPRTAHAGPIVGAGPGVLRTVLQLTAEPLAGIGAEPEAERRPLPDLEPVAAPARHFHVVLPLRVPYTTLNQHLAGTVVGASVDVGASRPLSVTEIQAYGSGAQLILQVGVTGPVTGAAYLAGTPVVDAESRALRLDGLAFTLESDSALVRTTGRVLHRRLLAELERRARLPLDAHLEALRTRLSTALNRELLAGVDLSTTVDRLELRGVYPVQDGLELVAVFGGVLRVIGR